MTVALCTISNELLLRAGALLGVYAALVVAAELTTPVSLDRKLLRKWLSEARVQSTQPHWSAPVFLVSLPILYVFLLPAIFPFRALGLACLTGFLVVQLCG